MTKSCPPVGPKDPARSRATLAIDEDLNFGDGSTISHGLLDLRIGRLKLSCTQIERRQDSALPGNRIECPSQGASHRPHRTQYMCAFPMPLVDPMGNTQNQASSTTLTRGLRKGAIQPARVWSNTDSLQPTVVRRFGLLHKYMGTWSISSIYW